MSFFITSVGKGDGANYGGLAGADAYCQQMAMAAGRGGAMWHAYLSTQGPGAVNARDRIGNGPWYNARGQIVAMDKGVLHGDTIDQARVGNAMGKQILADREGHRGEWRRRHAEYARHPHRFAPGRHGVHRRHGPHVHELHSNADGMGQVQLGHSDKQGGNNSSWNSAHGSRGLQPAESRVHRRRGTSVLLRSELRVKPQAQGSGLKAQDR
jgi:hypothetical protein